MRLVDVDRAVKQLREECDGCQLNEDQMDRECPTCWVTEAVDALEKLPEVKLVHPCHHKYRTYGAFDVLHHEPAKEEQHE